MTIETVGGYRRKLNNLEKALIIEDEEFGTHKFEAYLNERKYRLSSRQPDEQ